MNQIYLEKIVQQEQLNVKIQLVKEHIDIARQEFIQLNENVDDIKRMSLITEQETESEDKFAWKSPNDKVAEFIQKFPENNAVRQLNMGSNPYAYEVQVEIVPLADAEGKKSKYKNMFRFYEDGSVYDYNLMGRLGWNFKSNKIEITAKDPGALVSVAKDRVLATIDANGVFRNIAYTEQSKSMFDKPKEIPWLDTMQTILDWAGLIPVIGDALDILNAVIYFFRGKYFEGFLSLIAIIPVIGSVIKLGIKGAFKAATTGIKAGLKGMKLTKFSGLIKRWWLKGDVKALETVGVDLVNKGAMTPSELKRVGGFFGGFVDRIRAIFSPVKKLVGDNIVLTKLDDAARKLGKGADGFRKAANKAEAAAKAAKVKAKGLKIWKTPGKVFNFLTFGLLPKLRRMPFFPAKKLAAMADATRMRFIKRVAKDPSRLGALSKFMSVDGKKETVKQFKQAFGEYTKFEKKAMNDLLKANPLLRRYAGRGIDGVPDFAKLFDSGEHTMDFFASAKRMKGTTISKKLEGLGEIITTNSVDYNNPMWNLYKDADINKLISSQTAKTVQLQFAKNVDWIWNEMQMAGETLGFESSEHLGKVGLVPLTKWAMASSMPGGYAQMQKAKETLKQTLVLGKTTAKVAAGPFVQLDDLDQYPPIGADEYTSQEDEPAAAE